MIAAAARILVGPLLLLVLPATCWPTARASDESPTAPQRVAGGSAASSTIREQAEALKNEQFAVATRLMQAFPDDFDAWRVLGYVHSSHGNLQEMFRCWQKCQELQPQRADVYDQLGRYAVQIEQYETAIRYWQQALQLDPAITGVHQNIGYALLNLGRTEEASAALRKEIEVAPRSSQSYYLLGESLMQLEEFAKAKANYQLAVRMEPQHKHAFYGLVKACSRLGQTDEAASYASEFQRLEDAPIKADLVVRREYDDLAQMRAKVAVTCTEAGRVYAVHDDLQRAEQQWTRAAQLDPTNVACRKHLAPLYLRARKAKQALQMYLQLVRLQPRDPSHHQQVGFLHARLGNLPAAEAALQKVLELGPDQAEGHRALAKFYLNTKQRPARAQELAVAAVKLEPVADSYFVLGWASATNANFSMALAAAKEAVRLDPGNVTYRQLYQSIQKRK